MAPRLDTPFGSEGSSVPLVATSFDGATLVTVAGWAKLDPPVRPAARMADRQRKFFTCVLRGESAGLTVRIVFLAGGGDNCLLEFLPAFSGLQFGVALFQPLQRFGCVLLVGRHRLPV